MSVQAWAIRPIPFQVKRCRTATSSSSLRKSRARMRRAVMSDLLIGFGCRALIADEAQLRAGWARGRLWAHHAQQFACQVLRRTAHREAFDHDADRHRPELPRGRVGIAHAAPAVPFDLSGKGACAFGM